MPGEVQGEQEGSHSEGEGATGKGAWQGPESPPGTTGATGRILGVILSVAQLPEHLVCASHIRYLYRLVIL